MLDILGVEPGSIADELKIKPGDRLLSINGQPVRDLIDYLLAIDSEELLLEVERPGGEIWDLELEFDRDDSIGLILPHPEPDHCGNNCLFCFVHQLPKGLRKSLYVKDEDYRFSYLYGAYVTLTNLDPGSLQRIKEQRLSPLYVSVHATEEQLRERLLGRKGLPSILDLLKDLVEAGIVIHTQVVVCPGINDGSPLQQTFSDLAELAPGLRSLAVVPVGLTGYRQHLPHVRAMQPEEARAILDWVHQRQADCLRQLSTRFVFAADELYLLAGAEFPPLSDYEELAQVENGVGMIPQFRCQAEDVLAQAECLTLPTVSIVTGQSAEREIQRFARQLESKAHVTLRVHSLQNRFFGGRVTVAGLLTGRDLLEQLSGAELGEVLLLPDVMFREGTDILLDDFRISDLEQHLNVRIECIEAHPWGIWNALEMLAFEPTTLTFQEIE